MIKAINVLNTLLRILPFVSFLIYIIIRNEWFCNFALVLLGCLAFVDIIKDFLEKKNILIKSILCLVYVLVMIYYFIM